MLEHCASNGAALASSAAEPPPRAGTETLAHLEPDQSPRRRAHIVRSDLQVTLEGRPALGRSRHGKQRRLRRCEPQRVRSMMVPTGAAASTACATAVAG